MIDETQVRRATFLFKSCINSARTLGCYVPEVEKAVNSYVKSLTGVDVLTPMLSVRNRELVQWQTY